METVTISLNGRVVAGAPGTTILDLASQVGVDIPTLCHHPLLKDAGACRVCLVEEGKTGRLLSSCVTPISDGMEILTHSANAVAARRGVLELILSDHPSACVVCNKGNECTLRYLAKEHGICDPDLEPVRRWRYMEEVNPFIVRDLTKCILCGRCIRVCKDFEAVGAVDYADRGYSSHPGTARRTSLDESGCNFCGSCVALCPTDALSEKDRPSFSSGKERVGGICSYCGTGCHLEYELVDRVVVGARGVPGSPVNNLSLCVRGHYGQDALSSPERLTEPLIRDGSEELRKATWDEALGELARRLGFVTERFGPDSVGMIVGTQCSNEEIYLAVKLAREVLGIPHIDSIARFTSGTVADGLAASLSRIRPETPFLNRLQEAETVVLMGARPDYTHPVVARDIRRAVHLGGAALVQLDPVTTSLSPFARIRWKERIDELPVVLAQLMKELVRAKLHDETFVVDNVVNGKEFLSDINAQTRDVPVRPEIKQVARLLAAGRKSFFVFGSRVARATQGYILSRLLVDLALLCGQPDNILFLFEGCNEVGAWELGCAPDRLPGSLVSMDRETLEFLRTAWGRPDMELKRGLDAMSMIRAAEKGELRALILLGVDPLAIFPDTKRMKKALSAPDLVVRTGMFPAVDAETAHIVLPVAAVTETDGTYVSTEGRVQRVSKITDPPGNARPTARFIVDLAGLLGHSFGFVTARDIFEEITSTCPAWNGLTWENVARVGGMLLGNARDSRASAAGGTRKWVPYPPPDSFAAPPQPPPDRPWKVYPEAQAAHPGDGVVSGRSRRLARFGKAPSVRMNPIDAERIGARKGTWILLRSEVGEAKVQVIEDSEVPLSGLVVSAAGPHYIFQQLLPWPEEYCPPGWDRIHVSVESEEER
ncbi:MAG TPA: molybdopterin-dependent oxidoreductase [Desulfomonilaceae bacterium]|nr:molybdopterin-dependent oxidoreductase [Desulfomonilaceae bacterium]